MMTVMKAAPRRIEIPAGEFRARCLKLLDQVQQRRHEIIITKRGKPVARLAPLALEAPDVFGRMRGTRRVVGDIVSSPFSRKRRGPKAQARPARAKTPDIFGRMKGTVTILGDIVSGHGDD
jgi:prevent-host-death family protein